MNESSNETIVPAPSGNPKNDTSSSQEIAGLYYFVPPTTSIYMSTGRMTLFIILFLGMFLSIFLVYVFINREDYKTRLSYIKNSWIFGNNSNSSFRNYINSVVQQGFTTYTEGKDDDEVDVPTTPTESVTTTAWKNIQTWFGKTLLSSYLSSQGAIQTSKSLHPTTNQIVQRITGSEKQKI
jgi:hypothetical protein